MRDSKPIMQDPPAEIDAVERCLGHEPLLYFIPRVAGSHGDAAGGIFYRFYVILLLSLYPQCERVVIFAFRGKQLTCSRISELPFETCTGETTNMKKRQARRFLPLESGRLFKEEGVRVAFRRLKPSCAFVRCPDVQLLARISPRPFGF